MVNYKVEMLKININFRKKLYSGFNSTCFIGKEGLCYLEIIFVTTNKHFYFYQNERIMNYGKVQSCSLSA